MHIFGTTTLKELYKEGLISVRTMNACNYVGIETVNQIIEYIRQNGDLLNIPHLGKKSILEINQLLDCVPSLTVTSPQSPKKGLIYDKQLSLEIRDILKSCNVDLYVISCLAVPIIKDQTVEELHLELDYDIQSKWGLAIRDSIGSDQNEITSYIKDRYFRWYGLDLLQLICFEPTKLLDSSEWSSQEKHIQFLQKVQYINRLFITWLLRNYLYNSLIFVRVGFKDLETCIDDYLSEINVNVLSYKKSTNEYYNALIEDINNNNLKDIAKAIAPDFYDALYFTSLTYDSFSDVLNHRYKIEDIYKKDLHHFFLSIEENLIDVLRTERVEDIEYKVLKMRLPFVRQESYQDLVNFKRKHSHYPMLYLLKQILMESKHRNDSIYREYYGIGCQKNSSIDSLAKKLSSSKNTIINIIKRCPKCISDSHILQSKEWASYEVLQESVIEENLSALNDIIEEERLSISANSLVEGLFSLHNEYVVFPINGYSYYFKKKDFPDCNPVEGLKQLKSLAKSGSREAQTVFMFNLFGDHDFNTWEPFHIISIIIEQELGLTLINNEFIEIEARFDCDALLVEILENENKPMSLISITNQFNEKSPEPTINAESIKFKLNRIPDVVTIGKSGCYALKNWTDIYAGSIRDLIVEVMDEFGKPIALTTIVRRVQEFFPSTNEKSIETSLRMYQTHYSFTYSDNLYFCSQDNREEIYKEKVVELNPPSEDNRIVQMEKFLLDKQRFPLRQGCFAEASLRDWIHRVLVGEIKLIENNTQKFNYILAHYLDDGPEDSPYETSDNNSEDLLDSFFTCEFDNNNSIYVEQDPNQELELEQETISYIKSLCDIPYIEYINYVSINRLPAKWGTADITQNSNIDDCHKDICRAIIQQGNVGLDFLEIGKCLLCDGIERNIGAYRKYGENHVKSAEQLGLTFEHKGLWYLTCYGKVFGKLEPRLQNNFMARILLRNPFYANIISDASIHQIKISSYMDELSESTRIRRIPSVKKMLNIIMRACDVNEKVYYRLFDSINDNASDRINGQKDNKIGFHASSNLVPEKEELQGNQKLVAEEPDKSKTNAEKIVEYLELHPNQKAKDIATALGMERRVVNACFYGVLKDKVHQDNSYRWSLI